MTTSNKKLPRGLVAAVALILGTSAAQAKEVWLEARPFTPASGVLAGIPMWGYADCGASFAGCAAAAGHFAGPGHLGTGRRGLDDPPAQLARRRTDLDPHRRAPQRYAVAGRCRCAASQRQAAGACRWRLRLEPTATTSGRRTSWERTAAHSSTRAARTCSCRCRWDCTARSCTTRPTRAAPRRLALIRRSPIPRRRSCSSARSTRRCTVRRRP